MRQRECAVGLMWSSTRAASYAWLVNFCKRGTYAIVPWTRRGTLLNESSSSDAPLYPQAVQAPYKRGQPRKYIAFHSKQRDEAAPAGTVGDICFH